MSNRSGIEWTQQTWNPVIGCTKISAGCKHCYAETMSMRLKLMGIKDYEEGFKVQMVQDRVRQPLQRKKPTVYFVNSMSDLFHPEVTDAFISDVFDVMAEAEQHTFQVLTKRSDRLREFCAGKKIPDNIWLGVSVENKRHGLPRIDDLRGLPVATRFLSVEPLLENLGAVDLTGIHWVIVGGESGHGARRMREAWVKNVHEQCIEQHVPFFFKQWGAWGADGVRRSKKANGRLLNGREWSGYPAQVDEQMLTALSG